MTVMLLHCSLSNLVWGKKIVIVYTNRCTQKTISGMCYKGDTMSEKDKTNSRRAFLKTVGTIGAGSMFA